jgi:hypothetical protein
MGGGGGGSKEAKLDRYKTLSCFTQRMEQQEPKEQALCGGKRVAQVSSGMLLTTTWTKVSKGGNASGLGKYKYLKYGMHSTSDSEALFNLEESRVLAGHPWSGQLVQSLLITCCLCCQNACAG